MTSDWQQIINWFFFIFTKKLVRSQNLKLVWGCKNTYFQVLWLKNVIFRPLGQKQFMPLGRKKTFSLLTPMSKNGNWDETYSHIWHFVMIFQRFSAPNKPTKTLCCIYYSVFVFTTSNINHFKIVVLPKCMLKYVLHNKLKDGKKLAGNALHCLPQRVKSTFFENFFKWRLPKADLK